MMEDLGRADDEQSPTELASIVHAFELVGVRIEQIGSLPKAPAVAEAFVTICREAATNAVKHGQAYNVRICLRGKRQLVHAARNQRWLGRVPAISARERVFPACVRPLARSAAPAR